MIINNLFNRLNNQKITTNKPKGEKGIWNGTCNRSACDNQRATFYNSATYKYYCPKCAREINFWSQKDGVTLLLHEPVEIKH